MEPPMPSVFFAILSQALSAASVGALWNETTVTVLPPRCARSMRVDLTFGKAGALGAAGVESIGAAAAAGGWEVVGSVVDCVGLSFAARSAKGDVIVIDSPVYRGFFGGMSLGLY